MLLLSGTEKHREIEDKIQRQDSGGKLHHIRTRNSNLDRKEMLMVPTSGEGSKPKLQRKLRHLQHPGERSRAEG